MPANELSKTVISSRVRLARNVRDIPFPKRLNEEASLKLIGRIKAAASNFDTIKDPLFLDMETLSSIDRQMLVEKHLISPDLARTSVKSAVIISGDEQISIMINEEDHLRIQVINKGYDLKEAYKLCSKLDDLFDADLEFAFSPDYGYMTSCPTNMGTGLRASVMMHLPALVISGYIKNILEACSKLGIAVRGIYGENSSASGNMFQISNQVSLGRNEDEIINGIINISTQISEQESALRKRLYEQNPLTFEDKIWRSYGILSNARLINHDEILRLISDVRLGIDMGIINNLSDNKLDKMTLLTQTASIQKYMGREMSEEDINTGRAEIVRKLIDEQEEG